MAALILTAGLLLSCGMNGTAAQTETDIEDPADITGNTATDAPEVTENDISASDGTGSVTESAAAPEITETESSVIESSVIESPLTESSASDIAGDTGAAESSITETDAAPYTPQSPAAHTFWRDRLETPGERAAYDSFAAMVDELSDTAVFSEPIGFDGLSRVFRFFSLDHPEFFWGSGGYTATGRSDNAVSARISGAPGRDALSAMRSDIERAADSVLSAIPRDADEFEIEKAIFDWLWSNVRYDVSAPDAYSVYGALVGRRCVCEGFSEAFQYLCTRAGIETTSITGHADNGRTTDGHKWNAVRLSGKWYTVDPTWAVGAESYRYLYFNESGYISRSHSPDADTAGLLPDFSAKDMSYLNYYRLNFTDADFDEAFIRALAKFSPLADGGGIATVLMRAESPDAASRYADIISTDRARISNLTREFGKISGAEYAVAGSAGVVYDSVIFFSIYKK